MRLTTAMATKVILSHITSQEDTLVFLTVEGVLSLIGVEQNKENKKNMTYILTDVLKHWDKDRYGWSIHEGASINTMKLIFAKVMNNQKDNSA